MLCATWGLLALLPLSYAQGDDAGSPAASSEPASAEDVAAPALSPEELEALQRALEADLEATSGDAPAPTPSGPALGAPIPQRSGSGLAQNLNPDLSFVADVALAAFTADAPLQTGGHDPVANGFNLQQLEMAVGKPVDTYFRFDANVVFSQFGVEIEEVYATTLALPARLQVRAGQFLTRFGRANATHPHSWDFVDQPFPLGRVMGGEGNRGLGAEVSWLTPLPWYVELLVSENQIGGAATSKTWSEFTALGVAGPEDLQTTAALKQFFPMGPDLSLMWGLSWAGGPNGTGRDNRSEIYGTDLYLKHRPISGGVDWRYVALHSEWYWRRQQIPEDLLVDLSGFTQLIWRFAQRWAVAGRHELGTPSRGLDGEVAAGSLEPEWLADRQRISANVTFWPTEFSRLRLQGARDHAEWLEGPDWSAFLAFEFNVGAHGAHAF